MDILASLIRTVVPIIIGFLITWSSAIGYNVTDEQSAQLAALVTGIITALYYTGVRLLEQKWPQVGWFLGWAKQPVYADGK